MWTTEKLSWWHVGAFFLTVVLLMLAAEQSRSKFFAFVACVEMILVNGLRHGYIDTRAYRNGFLATNPSQVLRFDFLFHGVGRDRGFQMINGLIRMFTDNSQIFLLILGAITVGCLFYSLVNMTPKKPLAVFFFICTGCFLDTMNGMRQGLASALLFALLPELILERKFLKYVITVGIVSTIHGTALIFIPLYFVVQTPPWSKRTAAVVGLALLALVSFGFGLGGAMADALEGTSYGADYGEMLKSANSSVNFVRVLVAAVPVVLSFLDKKNTDKNLPMYTVAFNMSLVNLITWAFATKVRYFYRLAMYFQPYMIVLLCYELYYMRNRSKRTLYRLMGVVLFICWHILSLQTIGDAFFVGYLKY